jgi:uncharacterized membrane protein YfcA
MIGVFLVLILFTSLASGPAWWNSRRRGTWTVWDYASLIVPFGLWLGLASAGVGGESLSNIVEMFVLAAVIPTLHSVRVFFVDRRSKYWYRNSIIVFVVANLISIALRALVPTLPE